MPNTSPVDGWILVLDKTIGELRVLSDWASMTSYRRVRDLLQQAISELEYEKNRLKEDQHASS